MMDSHSSLLGIDSSSQHRGRTEDNANVTTIHRIYHRFLCFLVLALLNKTYLVCRDMVVLYQFSLDFRINIEVSTGLVSTQVRENELRPFLCIILLVIVIEHLGTVTCLVVDMV